MRNMSVKEKQQLLDQIDAALEDIRPHLKVDGGDVELVDVSDDLEVQIRWMGNCESCSMSAMTMKAGVEQSIRNKVPEIKGVKAINGLK